MTTKGHPVISCVRRFMDEDIFRKQLKGYKPIFEWLVENKLILDESASRIRSEFPDLLVYSNDFTEIGLQVFRQGHIAHFQALDRGRSLSDMSAFEKRLKQCKAQPGS